MRTMCFFAGICLLTASCSKESFERVDNEMKETAPVTVQVNDFSMSVDSFASSECRTRATVAPSSYNGMKAITLAFYSGSTEVFKATQVKGDATYATFGSFACHLPIGNYTMVVVGYGLFDGDEFTLSSTTSASFNSKARETFCATQTVNIANTNAVQLSATMQRIVGGMQLYSTDGRADGVDKMRITYASGGKSFNPSTGLATVNTGFAADINLSAAVGETIGTMSFMFLASDEQSINITVDMLDNADHVLFTKTIPNVPFKRNRRTILRGPLFTSTALASSTFQVEKDWLGETTVEF